jgi:16S rRNA (adenine1518-N6/adenine1519-N6)-dimethyltransferase
VTLTEIKHALQELNLRPSRRLGQNYLYDQNLARIIVQAAQIGPSEPVIEIGPGLGALTGLLRERTDRLEVVEKDSRAAAFLQARFPGLAVHHADALEFEYPADGPWVCIGNLPYSVGSRLIVRLCELEARPLRMVFTVQREVADRLTSGADVKDYGVLSLLTQPWYRIETVRRLPASVFFPEPDVESSVVRFERRDCRLAGESEARYRQIVKKAFQHRRKTLGAIFGRALSPLLNPKSRPAEISVDEWIAAAMRPADGG